MSARFWTVGLGLLGLLGLAVANGEMTVVVSGQSTAPQAAAAKPKSFATPKTPWGHPDLQGVWTSDDMLSIPMERPEQFAGRAELTDEEFADRAKRDQAALERNKKAVGAFRGDVGSRSFRQTSRVIEPADGRVPPITPEAQRRVDSRQARRSNAPSSWEDRSLYDRCITRGILGSTLPVIYGNGNQILQTPTSVVINYEMVHDTRVIPLDGRPHVGHAVRLDMGDARGHWEGSTLVVETTNFGDRSAYRNANAATLRLVERFTPTAPGRIEWAVTVDDPMTWTRRWTFAMPLTMNDREPVLEFACHEGNYAVPNILSAARSGERNKTD